MQTLQEFMTQTKGLAYIVAFLFLAAFIVYWLFLTDREDKR